MATFPSLKPNLVLSPFSRTQNPQFHRSQFGGFSKLRRARNSSAIVAQFGFEPGFLPDPGESVGIMKELFLKAESVLYTIADAAVSSSEAVDTTAQQNNDWLSGITNYMESVLKVLKDGLSTLHVPYAYGFAIILLTVIVKAATFPLTKKQVESAMAMRSLQPQIKAIQERYAGDQERIQLETARLYKLAGINPLAGCLPTLATIPVWLGLYRALSNVANEGLLTEGFFWIPSLAGPTTIAARQNGSGISWLFPFVDGHPPLGWSDTCAYLVLPLLLVASQYISIQIMQSSQNNDPSMKSSQALTRFLPLMIGYFALSVPSGLSLYWLTNNILSTGQQVWLQKFGGAKNPVSQLSDVIRKEEKPQGARPLSEPEITKKATKNEKSTPEGPRPGDRFKQLKEQEARRRRQRQEEEERRKAKEVTARANQMTDGHTTEAGVLDKESELRIDHADRNDETHQSVESQDPLGAQTAVNGALSSEETTEDQSSVGLRSENIEASSSYTVDLRMKQQSCDEVEKEYTTITTTDNKSEGED